MLPTLYRQCGILDTMSPTLYRQHGITNTDRVHEIADTALIKLSLAWPGTMWFLQSSEITPTPSLCH